MYNLSSFWEFYEIRGEGNCISRVIIVGRTVSVDIAEIVVIVVISRALPPISGGTRTAEANTKSIQKHTYPRVKKKNYLFLSLLSTVVIKLFSLSMRPPSLSDILLSFSFAVVTPTAFLFAVSKHPWGLSISMS